MDIADYGVFQFCFSGAGNPADPSCGFESEIPEITQITLNGTSISVDGIGVTVDGTTATITTAGTFNITGTLNDGQIVVNAAAGGLVEMILDGVNISNSTSAPIFVMNAGSVEVILADQTQNYLDDAETYVYETRRRMSPTPACSARTP